ncbi:carbohydrate ABC transporter permease, partial [Bradyrhizobium sp. NBAIM08]|nr:carbohydrate ABC transporter permease [Bradyrhizobium sp. NBAIM08]
LRMRPGFALANLAAWLLAIIWISPLLYGLWTAFHPAAFAARFDLSAPWTLENFERVWTAAPFARYFVNTFLLVSLVLACQLVVCTLAAYAFVCYPFRGSNALFVLVLVQLMIMPEVLLVENYRTLAKFGLLDTILG